MDNLNHYPLIGGFTTDDEDAMVVVGNCVFCGCPIYGQQAVKPGKNIPIRHTCSCATTNQFKSLGTDKERGGR